jgi:predicted transposase YdaD
MDLEETAAVQSWMRRGEERGMKQGIKQGFQQGLLEGHRGTLLAVLSARFGQVEKDLEARILTIEDATLLERLIRRAVVVPSPDHFFREMP